MGVASTTLKGQTYFKNKNFWSLGVAEPPPRAMRWLRPPHGSTWMAGHPIVFIFYFSFFIFIFLLKIKEYFINYL
jgi:hypothetical protein